VHQLLINPNGASDSRITQARSTHFGWRLPNGGQQAAWRRAGDSTRCASATPLFSERSVKLISANDFPTNHISLLENNQSRLIPF